MANVRVAVRVRPLSKRETKEGGKIIVEIDDKVAKIRNIKVDSRPDSFGDSREKVVAFSFDYCYWSVDPEDPQYASQDVVFQGLGTEVLSGAAKGYNVCLFAYGQTGSGKTHTMLGTPASVGLTPRICEGLFIREEDCASLPSSCRIKVSFLEIYNERVRDLLKQSDKRKSYTLRVREHPEMGPYVQGLSQHVVTSYKQVIQLLEEGIANRITAATHVHEASSRSHAIFTIHYSQAIVENNLPSEIASKINLVDLAGSERADPSYCKDRITEGANINKSLVTLGIVISTLAQNSQASSSCRSLGSPASSGGGDNGTPYTLGTSSGGEPSRRQSYIPYRDSVLTWLLKDSLGGNSKTIMVATVSPAHTSYSETMSTLRYASNAKNIVNKPLVNEDANVKLIRELREEIRRLKAMLLSFKLRNFSSVNDKENENLKELVLQNELKMDKLTNDWTQKWHDWQALMEHYSVDVGRRRAGVVIDSSLPHLMALEEDVLSTGVALYHLKEECAPLSGLKRLAKCMSGGEAKEHTEGTTKIGRIDSDQEQDIVLQGQWIERDHCTITSACGVVILRPAQGARCTVNGRKVTASCRLTQGALITLGKAQKFRFSHPAEAAVLRQQRQVAEAIGSSGSLEWLDLDADVPASRLSLCPLLWKQRRVLEEQSDKDHQPPRDRETSYRAHIQQQQCCVEDLRQQIQAGQIGAERDLEWNQACTHQKIGDNRQWLFREQQQEDDLGAEKESEALGTPDIWLQTDPDAPSPPLVQSQKRLVQLQLSQRRAPQAVEQNIPRKKASLQVDGFIKNQRLVEAQARLEQLRALCWLQDESTQQLPRWIHSSDATAPQPPSGSGWAHYSSLCCQRLCSEHLPPLHSAFLNWDRSTMLPPMPDPTQQVSEKIPLADHVSSAAACLPRTRCLHKSDLCPSGQGLLCMAKKDTLALGTCLTVSHKSVNIQEVETMEKQLSQMVSQGIASLCQLPDKLKPRDEPKTLNTTQTKRAKGLADSGNTKAVSQKEGNLGANKAARGTSYSYSYPHGPKQAAGHRRVAKTFQMESKLPFPGRESKRHQRVLAARVRDIAKKYCHLPHGHPLKRQHSVGDPDAKASHTDSSLVMDCARGEDDLSDTDSNYSVDSLSHVCAKASLTEMLMPEDPPGKWCLPKSENSESHNSQISQDLLVEREDQSLKGGSHTPNKHSRPRSRTKASTRTFPTSLDSGLLARAHRSFSLDSLVDAEEELEEDQQEEPFLNSANEMPTETFWGLQNSILPVVDQEAMCRPGPTSHRTGVGLNTILPVSSSFYLNPQFQANKEWSESEVEASYPEQASSLQGTQLSRESSLVSMNSWFSCDSKINPSSPPRREGSLCLSPVVQEVQPCDEERLAYLQNSKELKPLGIEAVPPDSSKWPQGSTELPCSTGDVLTTSASSISKLSLWGTQRLLQPGADDFFQGSSIPDTTQPGNSEISNSSVLSEPTASAASFTHVGSTHEGNWAALQQKYLLEVSHPVLEAVRQPRPSFPYLEEDSSSLVENSGKGRDSQLPVSPGVSSSLNFNNFPVLLSKTRRLRAEKEQDSLGAKLESASDFFSTSEKEVSCNGAYSADLESLASGSTNTQVCAIENKITYSLKESQEVRQKSLEECCQDSRKPGVMASSDKYVVQKNAYCRNVTQATRADHQPQGWSPLRKNSAVHQGQISHNCYPQQEEKACCQESSEEVVGRCTDISFALPSGPESYFHSAPWNPLSSSLQPPVLETYYVTKSRDALTETALEIPACREVQVPSPPPREAWGFSHDHQILKKTYLKNNLSVLSQSQNSKIAFSQQATAERPVDLKTREVSGELGEYTVNIKEERHNSVHFLVAQNRHFLPFTGTEVCELEKEVQILNKKHSLPALTERDEGPALSCWSVSLDNSEPEKPFLFICDSEAGRKEEQAQIQDRDMSRQFPSAPMSDFICKTTDSGLKKDMPGETAIFLKSRLECHRVSSPMIIAQDESSTHKWEGSSETGLLGETVHPEDTPTELKLSEMGCTCERVKSITCYQERSPSKCQGPRGSQEMLNSEEELLGKKHYKGVNNNNADEMAKLIRSIMQLENGILEIESKQNKEELHVSYTPRISEDIISQDQKDPERADCILSPRSSGKHLSCKDQPSSPRQADGIDFRDSEAGGAKANRTTGNKNQVLNVSPSPFRSGECVQHSQSVVEHALPDGLDRCPRDTCDSLGKGLPCRETTNTAFHQKREEALSRAPSLHPQPESSGMGDRLVSALASFKDQPWGLGSLEALETMKGFQEGQAVKYISSSKPEWPRAQGGVEEMTLEMGGSPQDKSNMVSLTQKHPSPSQHCICTYCSQETSFPLLSKTDFSTAPSNRDLSNTWSLPSPMLPESCLHTPDIISISSVDHVLDPTILKISDNPSEHEVGYDSKRREDRSMQGDTRGGSSMAYTAWCGDVSPMVLGLHGQSDAAESISLGTEGRITANIPQDRGGDLRITSMGLHAQESFGNETEAAVQKEIQGTFLNTASRLEKRVSFSLEEDDDQGRGARQKTQEEAKDQSPTSRTCSLSVSLPRVSNQEPQLLETSVHASICLAILEEIRQAKVWRKQPNNFGAGATVLPYYETSVEPECSSGASGRIHCERKDQLMLGRTRNEDEAPECDVASLSAAAGQLLAVEKKGQVTPLYTDGSGPLPSPEVDRGPQPPPQSSSLAAPTPGTRSCTGDLRDFQGARKEFTDHSISSEITEKKKACRILFSDSPLVLDGLLPSRAVEVDRVVRSEKAVYAVSSQAPQDPGLILHGQSQLATWHTVEGKPPGSCTSSPEHQEPETLDTTYRGGLCNFLATAWGGKTAHFESQSVISGVENSLSFSETEQDHVQCSETSTGLEKVRASPKQQAVLPGAQRNAGVEAPLQQCVNWEQNAWIRMASKNLRPTPLLDQRPSPDPREDEAPCRGPEKARDCLVLPGNTQGTRAVSAARETEESRTCQQLCSPQTTATHACSSHSSTLLCHSDGDLRTKAAPYPVYPPFIVHSRACEMGEIGETSSKEADVLLAHSCEPKGMDLGPINGSVLEPSTAATVRLPTQGHSSLCTSCVRTQSLTQSATDLSSKKVVGIEEVAERKASQELEAAPCPAHPYSEALKNLRDHCLGGHSAQVSQTKPEPSAETQGPYSLRLSEGSVENEHGCLENIRCLSEKPQPSTESRDPPVKFVAKHICSTQGGSPWEEEEQQRDWASGGNEDPPWDRSTPLTEQVGLNGCHIRDAGREEVVVTKSLVSQTFLAGFERPASVPLVPHPADQRPGQLFSNAEQLTPHHRRSPPMITVFSGPKHSKCSPRPQFSMVSSRSLQELNRVESSSPPDEGAQGLHRLWSPHLRGYSAGKMVTGTPLKTEDYNSTASSNQNNAPTDHMPLKCATPPYPLSSTVSCTLTPNLMNSWVSGALAPQGNPEKLGVQVSPKNGQEDKGMLYLGSSDFNPCIVPWCPEGPVHIGWKHHVFGGAVDVSCSRKAPGPVPSNAAWCCSMDNSLRDQKPPVCSCLHSYAQTHYLSSTHSSPENLQGSNEAWNIGGASCALGHTRVLSGPHKVPQFKGPTDEAGCLKSGLPLAEGISVGAVDEIVLLCPSESGCPLAQGKTDTYEQGTQTPGCQLHQSGPDVFSPEPDTSVASPCGLASWASMHSLSLHLSQLLHSTSELLGSLSQPGMAKEQNTKMNPTAGALQPLRMDSATQTSVEKGSQTDGASPPLHFQEPEAKPQEVSVILEVLNSDTTPVSQEKGVVTGPLGREAEEMVWKASDLHEEGAHCTLRSSSVSSSHLMFQKAPLEQNLPSGSPPASLDASSSPSSHPEDSSCVVVNSPSLSMSHTPGPFPRASEPTLEPQVQKKPGPTSTLLVDRASSPILTLSANTQELGLPSGFFPQTPSAHPSEGHPKLDFTPRPPADSSQTTHDVTIEAVDQGGSGKSFLELSPPCSPTQSSSIQVSFLGQPLKQPQPRTTTGGQNTPAFPLQSHLSQRLAGSCVSEGMTSPERGPLSSQGPGQWQSRPEHEGKSSVPPVEPQLSVDLSLSWKVPQHSSCPGAELTDPTGSHGSTADLPQACQPQGVYPSSQMCMGPESQPCNLRDLPVHNKFSTWHGVQHDSPEGLGVSEEIEASSDLSSGEQRQGPLQPGDQSLDPEWSPRKQVSLQVGAQSTPLSVELTEAKLHHGFGEADALLLVLQRGTGVALVPDEAVMSTWEQRHARQRQAIEILKREQAERLQNFPRTRSLSLQKKMSLLSNRAFPSWDQDLPSRRREYLQQLRKDVVEITRSPESAPSSAHSASDIEQMLRDYQQAREEAKVEIARAQERLRERTAQEKLRIRQQIISQLLREEEKLHTLASSGSPCTSSNRSLSSGVTSGYNSSPAFSGQLQPPESVRDLNLPDSRDTWIGDGRSYSAVRNSHLYMARSAQKGSAYSERWAGRRGSLSSCCCSASSLSSLGTCFSSSYQDLAKHIVDTSMADVMAACSDNLHNLFIRQATAGWNYQGEEQEVQLYYKEFSSTRHGFLGAGVVAQPLSHVWAAVSDPTLWPLYHKTVQTARLHQRVTNSISLVYLVCNASLCALKQPRDFCCVCVEAKEGHLSIVAVQSVYDTSMPRPSRKMVRGEILPSAWILQPVTVEGKEMTRVIYLAQVELGAPGFPPHLLSSFIKQQPLIVAKLASFLGS